MVEGRETFNAVVIRVLLKDAALSALHASNIFGASLIHVVFRIAVGEGLAVPCQG